MCVYACLRAYVCVELARDMRRKGLASLLHVGHMTSM